MYSRRNFKLLPTNKLFRRLKSSGFNCETLASSLISAVFPSSLLPPPSRSPPSSLPLPSPPPPSSLPPGLLPPSSLPSALLPTSRPILRPKPAQSEPLVSPSSVVAASQAQAQIHKTRPKLTQTTSTLEVANLTASSLNVDPQNRPTVVVDFRTHLALISTYHNNHCVSLIKQTLSKLSSQHLASNHHQHRHLTAKKPSQSKKPRASRCYHTHGPTTATVSPPSQLSPRPKEMYRHPNSNPKDPKQTKAFRVSSSRALIIIIIILCSIESDWVGIM
ncbi:hypothetical protein ACLB2K_051039 [Fragaria x ananassa]